MKAENLTSVLAYCFNEELVLPVVVGENSDALNYIAKLGFEQSMIIYSWTSCHD
jgi:hypothetical protein